MTREESIESLNAIREKFLRRYGEETVINIPIDGDDMQALDMAIKALEQDTCEDEYIKVPKKALKYRTTGMVAYNVEWLKSHFDMERVIVCGEQEPQTDIRDNQVKDELNRVKDELEPCEDYISREKVLKLFATHDGKYLYKAIRDMPSVKQEPKTGWIPVSQELPQKLRFVNCTCHSLIDDREDWVIETVYIPQPLFSPYSDWGNIPMLNHGECEVIAWVYRDIPEPYQREVDQ